MNSLNSAASTANDSVRPKHKGSAQLFQNPLLERLSHTHIAWPVGIFLGTALMSGYYGYTHGFLRGVSALGLFLAGWLLFTYLEYIVHRYLYHLSTTTARRAKLQYTIHGVHHEFPKDKTRLAMPPIITVFVASLLFFIFRLVFSNWAFGLLAGFTFGYASYLFVHYAIHAYAPLRIFCGCGGFTTASIIIAKNKWPSGIESFVGPSVGNNACPPSARQVRPSYPSKVRR
ncbi:sterol desaturase family protein [Hymenobacter volaticus]|uniref:sterol desaturase family protein n=1 Tax=Hymenobacter volaticus TaxID=2932254 RepID=UPI0028801D36|nr:sterol desaturase family protein [Hymenobacter volaticus]